MDSGKKKFPLGRMQSLSSSTEQAYYKLQRKEKELRTKIETERESSVSNSEMPGYLVAKYETAINLQKKKLTSVESEYERKKQSYLQQISFFQNLLDTLETTFPRQREEIDLKLRVAEETYEKEKEKYSQEKKTKIQIKAEKELAEVLRQKELLLPSSLFQELSSSTSTPAKEKAQEPEPDTESESEDSKKEPVPQPPSNTVVKKPIKKPTNIFLAAEMKRAYENVEYQMQLAEREARERKRAEEEKKEKDRDTFLLNKRLQEEADERRRKERMEELKSLPGDANPFVPKPYSYTPDSDEEDDNDSVAQMDEEEFQKEIQRRKEEQRKKFNFIKPQPVDAPAAAPILVGNTKQKKSIKSVSFRG